MEFILILIIVVIAYFLGSIISMFQVPNHWIRNVAIAGMAIPVVATVIAVICAYAT